MSAFLAIVADTWRQSRQQMVFILMLCVMSVIVIGAIAWPDPMTPRLTQRTLSMRAFDSVSILPETTAPRGLVAADLDGDGEPDLALLDSSGLRVWKGAKGEFTPGPTHAETGDAVGLEAIQVDGQGGAELVLFGPEGVTILRYTGEGFELMGTGCAGPVSDLTAADLDQDGDLDLICAGPAARVWFNEGAGVWSGGPTLGELQHVATGDLDADGDLDVVGSRGVEVLGWKTEGKTLAAPEILTKTRSAILDLATARLMGPGQPCVVLTSRVKRMDFFVHGTTRWVSVAARPASTPEVERILVTDYNGDGVDDLGLFTRSVSHQSELWPTVLKGGLNPQFGGPVQLGAEARGLSAVYRLPGEKYPRIVGLEGFEGIDIPLYGVGNNALFEAEDASWRQTYYESLMFLKARGTDHKELSQREAMDLAVIASGERTALERHAELLAIKSGKLLYTFSMIFFIAACSGYFPGLLREGGVDLVLARPISRLKIYLGKFCGGLVLYALASTVASGVLVLGIGIRFGSFPVTVLAMIPLQVFTAAVMFSILAAIGVVFRSTALPLMFGLFFYLAVDTGLGLMIQVQTESNVFGDGLLGKSVEWSGVLLPNFDLLKFSAQAAALKLNQLALRPMLTAGAWLIGFLAIGYWRFRSSDY
ncbi:MAG: VCBS repeat-containing protein [Planctomycetes bacterium]|nr:VCBS repeat-containing protein [Planctomycetota bacterium]